MSAMIELGQSSQSSKSEMSSAQTIHAKKKCKVGDAAAPARVAIDIRSREAVGGQPRGGWDDAATGVGRLWRANGQKWQLQPRR